MDGLSSSGSDDGVHPHYQPVLAEQLHSVQSQSTVTSSPGAWPREPMNVYTNDLFKDEQEQQEQQQASGRALDRVPSGQTRQMTSQKSSLAQRRADRLQAANIYQSNTNGMTRQAGAGIGSPHPPAFERPQPPGDYASMGLVKDPSSIYGLKGTYDPNDDNPQQITVAPGIGTPTKSVLAQQFAGGQQQQAPVVNPRAPPPAAAMDLSDLSTFLMQPGPRSGAPVMCYIVRDKGSAKMYPRYSLYLEDPKMFLLAARKRKKQTTSNYLISLDPEDLNRDSSKFFGKLRANFVGTEFTVFDGGDKPGKATSESSTRQELGAVTYQYNVLGTRGPRKMTGVIPAVDNQNRRVYRPTSDSDSITERMKTGKGLHELVIMHNKPPRWNDELNAYCLNFNGRVTEASVKNFQLVTDENQNHVILQFGKIGKNTFTMDYMWPMNALQAFSICLSSFDNKLACE